MLAAVTPEGVRHFHLDHLGTPRLITDAGGSEISRHTYLPFGEEANPSTAQAPERRKFTGHERDSNGLGSSDDLDYMHARFCTPTIGRFLSSDPGDSADPRNPQSLNRYTYALNNPLRYVDPDGLSAFDTVNGFFNAIAGNFLLGATRVPPVNDDFARGQVAGDKASILLSVLEIGAGISAALGGTGCTVASVGICTPVGVPAAVVGVIVAAHGTAFAGTAAGNLANNQSDMSAQSGRSGGRREGRGRGANRRDRQQIEDAAKQAGIDRKEFRKYVHDVKRGEGRGGAENFSYEELIELAEEFKTIRPPQ